MIKQQEPRCKQNSTAFESLLKDDFLKANLIEVQFFNEMCLHVPKDACIKRKQPQTLFFSLYSEMDVVKGQDYRAHYQTEGQNNTVRGFLI